MSLNIDFATHRIKVEWPQTAVTVDEVYTATCTAEATANGLLHDRIATASGKEVLGSGVAVGLTVLLLDDWQMEFWPGNYTATIGGGNLVAECGDPVAYVQGGPQVEITLSAAATIVTPQTDHAAIAAAVWAYTGPGP